MALRGAEDAVTARARRTGAPIWRRELDGADVTVIRQTATRPFWSAVPWTLVTVVTTRPTVTATEVTTFARAVLDLVLSDPGSRGGPLETVTAAALLVTDVESGRLAPLAVEPLERDGLWVWPVVVDARSGTVVRAPRRSRGGASGPWVHRRIAALARDARRATSG